jgi:ubiquinone biosynthesis protein
MSEQVGWRGLVDKLRAEAPRYSHIFPQLPRLAHQVLTRAAEGGNNDALLASLIAEQRATNSLLRAIIYIGVGILVGVVLAFSYINFFMIPVV